MFIRVESKYFACLKLIKINNFLNYYLSAIHLFFFLSAFLPMFYVGDFGEENVELVQSVANLQFAKAVILGNHDSWYTQQFSGK